MVPIFDLPSALAPSLVAAGYGRTEDRFFERDSGNSSIEFELNDNGKSWWVIIVINSEIRSESKVDSLTQVLRLLWTFGCIELVEETPEVLRAEA